MSQKAKDLIIKIKETSLKNLALVLNLNINLFKFYQIHIMVSYKGSVQSPRISTPQSNPRFLCEYYIDYI